MTKIRIIIFLITLFFVSSVGIVVSLYARGYRFDTKTLKFVTSGLLVLKSDPEAAQVFINGELKTATNATISLPPGTYDVTIKKEGFYNWEKRLTIEKEVVTEADASLFRTAASLTPLTFLPSIDPVASRDYTKIAYATAFDPSAPDRSGLWVIDTLNLPLGFSRDPRRITDGDLADATWEFSPNGREILLTTQEGVFLLDSGNFTPQNQRVNVASRSLQILADWEKEEKTKLNAQIRNLPEELVDLFNRKASQVIFSPDEKMILYTASGSATLSDNLIKQLPGASTQKQERSVEEHQTYVYDIKEDRNFLVNDDTEANVVWFPTSRHLILSEEDKISVMDYDGTNGQTVYSGSYIFPHAYPFVNTSRLLILTNLGANSSPPNLYSLSIK